MDCPNCDYDLTGLPAIHVCPECGFVYDPHAIVVALRKPRRLWLNLGGAILLPVVGWFYIGEVGSVAFFVILAAWYAFQIARRAGLPAKLSINREGVRFEHPDEGEFFRDWSGIARAKYHWFLGRLRLYDPEGKRVANWPNAVFGGQLKSNRCAKLINRLAQEYRRRER